MSDTKQIVRQLDILRTLLAQTYGVSYRKLTDESGVDKRTIQRDLKDLSEAASLSMKRCETAGKNTLNSKKQPARPELSHRRNHRLDLH